MHDDLFIKYYHENLEYMDFIQSNWIKIKSKINTWLKEFIRIKFSRKVIDVYVIHPNLNTGKCVSQKFIFWGHWKGLNDINYNIAYLCHENLHSLLTMLVVCHKQ